MPQLLHSKTLSVLSFVLMTGCGGGGDGLAGAGTDGASNTAGATASTSTAGTTTTSSLAGTTTTTMVGATSTSAATTTTSTYGDTTTTTSSSTTTTANPNLPPLSGTPIVLDAGPNGTLGVRAWADGNTASGGKGAPVGNANCIKYEWLSTNYFVHAHVSIFRDGQRLAIPQYIGMAADCLYEVNTDNMSGVVDAFSNAYKRLTLGDLFAVWGQPLSWNNVAGFTDQPVVIYVEDNGALRQHEGDPGDIELSSHRSITIQIGTRLGEIPVYNWSSYSGN